MKKAGATRGGAGQVAKGPSVAGSEIFQRQLVLRGYLQSEVSELR